MPTYDPNNYEPVLIDKRTRAEILRANGKGHILHRAGPKNPLRFQVFSLVDESEKPVMATGALNQDGTKWLATFIMPDGTAGSCEYNYQELRKTILATY